jgi:hypothetical protein
MRPTTVTNKKMMAHPRRLVFSKAAMAFSLAALTSAARSTAEAG